MCSELQSKGWQHGAGSTVQEHVQGRILFRPSNLQLLIVN
jgi:hypothetical protein